ncbi:MAG: hypothetical protein FVQ83_15225 [Chloroflexi bacterium]|nr:hypothetical protein [Chloroflexota bacterium]
MIEIERRPPPLYLITGLILGLALGLFISWWVSPVELIDTQPATLREDFKDQYRAVIAAAYAADNDFGRAQARLALLQDLNPADSLAAQAQLTLAEEGSQETARALGLLAAAFRQQGTPSAGIGSPSSTPTPDPDITVTTTPTPGPSLTPTLTNTPLPSLTPTATQGAAFIVDNYVPVCDPNLERALIQVMVFDAARRPVPGVRIIVTWGEDGEDTFYTGLKPELGLGYADFEMTPGILYTLELAQGDQPVSGLTAHECVTDEGERIQASWEVVFVQP